LPDGKLRKTYQKNSSMLPMRRSDGPERYGKRGPRRCLTPQSSKNRKLSRPIAVDCKSSSPHSPLVRLTHDHHAKLAVN
jgi:hypothetical protein